MSIIVLHWNADSATNKGTFVLFIKQNLTLNLCNLKLASQLPEIREAFTKLDFYISSLSLGRDGCDTGLYNDLSWRRSSNANELKRWIQCWNGYWERFIFSWFVHDVVMKVSGSWNSQEGRTGGSRARFTKGKKWRTARITDMKI